MHVLVGRRPEGRGLETSHHVFQQLRERDHSEIGVCRESFWRDENRGQLPVIGSPTMSTTVKTRCRREIDRQTS